MAKWTWSKYDLTKSWKKYPHTARYGYILKDEKGFPKGHITYFPSTKEYNVYRPSEVWGSWADVLIGKYNYLSDAKRNLESYWGKKITPSRKKRNAKIPSPFGL